MLDFMAIWGQWLRPSAGLPTVQWSLLLAIAAVVGHLGQRHLALPKLVGYSAVGALAGWAGFSGAAWPLQGIGLFLLELGVSVVLFQTGGRIALRWFRHNPMVLLQSLLEAAFTYAAVYATLRWFDVRPAVADAVALVAIVSSPAVLSQVVSDTRGAGPVTERAIVLSALGALYALTVVAARAGILNGSGETRLAGLLYPVLVVLGLSVVVGAVIALALRLALQTMNPASENTAILLVTTIAAGTALAAHFGGSAPLAALLAGLLLKQLHPRPWAWPRQLGMAASLLLMLSFLLVSVVAAQADWNPAVASTVLAWVAARSVAKVAGVLLANPGSGTSWRQALGTGLAMAPLSSLALLLVSQVAVASPALGPRVAAIALPAILLMEVFGAILATFVIYQAGESSRAGDEALRG
jgi:Kef-type K+ transport system membrane component KefB